MSLPNDTSRCTGRFDTVPGQLGAQLHGHCIGCLRTEAVAADIRIANDALVIAGLTAERDALKAERADLLSLALQAKRHHDKVVAELEMSKMKTYAASISPIAKERDELRAALADRDARLAALKKQKPVAWLVYANGSHRYSTLTFDVSKVPDIYVGGDVVALYVAAGAAPVPEGWQLVPVEPTPDMCEVLDADLHMLEATKGEQP